MVKKMKIVILSRNSKLYSTRRLVESAKERGHEVSVIDHTKCNILIEGGNPKIQYNGEELSNFDALIPRIGASVTFFGTAVVRQFEVMNVFCANGSQSIVRSRDKLRSLQIISQLGIGIPKTIFANHPKDNDVEGIIKQLGKPPLIIKILEGTQGLGVVLAETQKAAKSVIEAFSGLKANILIQEFIKEAGGADIRAFVVDGKVVGSMKRQGKEGDFRSNLHRGGFATIIELSKEEEEAAIGAAKAMELKVAGVDILQSSRGPLILEVNSSPGLQGIETATKLDIAGEIISFLERNILKGKHNDEI
jgi:ribosomal protein S6--L-glutamate ligase